MSSFDVPQLLILVTLALIAAAAVATAVHLARRGNQTLSRRSAQFHNLLAQAPLASGYVDKRGVLLQLDHQLAANTLWFKPDEVQGTELWELAATQAGVARGLRSAFETALRDGSGSYTADCDDLRGVRRRFAITFSLADDAFTHDRLVHLVIADRSREMTQEAELKRANEYYDSLLLSSDDAIFCIEYDAPAISLALPVDKQVDAMYEGRIVECNDVLARRFGRSSRQDVIGSRMSELIPRSTDAEQFLKRLAEARFAMNVWDHGAVFGTDTSGTQIEHLNCSAEIVDGHVTRNWNVVRDVSDMLKEADDSAMEAERRKFLLQAREAYYCYEFSPAMDTALPLAAQIERIPTGRLVECNAAFARLFNNRAPEDIVGLTMLELRERATFPIDDEKLSNRLQRFIEGGYKLENDRDVMRASDGSNFVNVLNCRGVVKDGGLTHLWAMMLDHTEREETEQDLRRSEARFERMAKNSPALIYRLRVGDPPVLEFANDAIEAISGYTREEALLDTESTKIFAAENLSLLTRTLQEKDSTTVLTRHLHRSGRIVYLEHRTVAVYNSDNQLRWIEGVALDVTEQLNAQQQLQTALNEISKLKDELQQENVQLRDEIRSVRGFDLIVGNSAGFREVIEMARRAAPTASTVLLLGETGTGKELFAQSIHSASSRSDKPIISVNCAALPPSLIESELFGHVRGAFTGAESERAGRFQAADGGTLFLDEIGELSLDLQGKLLRVIQEREVQRLGANIPVRVDVRLIAATNTDLAAAVERGEFRADLYYRLNVFPITIPPLRERVEDIPILANHFAIKHCNRLGKAFEAISPELIQTLNNHHWPGNVRELESAIERSIIVSPGGTLQPVELQSRRPAAEHRGVNELTHTAEVFERSLQEAEKLHIARMLEQTSWVIEGPLGAAMKLGIAPSTLRSKMKKLGIRRPELGESADDLSATRQIH